MATGDSLYDTVRDAWASIPPPSEEDMKFMEWGWGEAAAQAFIGVAPVNVDIRSRGFYAATPLLDLPPSAAAAYLGTFVLSLLRTLEQQKATGIYPDIITRSHTLVCLTLPSFWEQVVRPFLSTKCREALAQVAILLASEREALALTQEQADAMVALATAR
jgi:hypothetical protein